MATTYIIIENEHEFAVYIEGQDRPVSVLPHDEELPPLCDDGYEDEFVDEDDDERDVIGFSTVGCPIGYVIVVIRKPGRRMLCILYGPSGYIRAFSSESAAAGAAIEDANSPRPSGGGRNSGL